VSFKTVRYSFWSTRPFGAAWKKFRSVSRARRASSWVGEFGADDPGGDCKPVTGVLAEGGAIDPLLLLWWSGGDETAESIPKGGGISRMGESRAEDGVVSGMLLYFGVIGSVFWATKDGSMPNIGKVWLRGRWKLFPGGGRRACCEGSHELELLSGEKANGVVGLVGPAEKAEFGASVNELDNEVVLWELACL
jgi:hypothetical protein